MESGKAGAGGPEETELCQGRTPGGEWGALADGAAAMQDRTEDKASVAAQYSVPGARAHALGHPFVPQ